MPLDPKFETSAGLQRFREQILRENKSRMTHSGHKTSEAALEFLRERKRQLEEEQKEADRLRNSVNKADSNTAVNASRMGVRGTAGRSGVVSSTQRHVVDEGYDMVLKSEWAAACEGVNSKDPVFLQLNEGTIGKDARTIHVQREESARRVNDTRSKMMHDKEAEQEWVERAHRIVDEGWERAKKSSLSQATPSDYANSMLMSAGIHHPAHHHHHPRGSNNSPGNASTTTYSQSCVGGSPASASLYETHKKTNGLRSDGVRCPTYTKERHEDLTRRVRSIYEKPPPPRKDIHAALEHITKTSLPNQKREFQPSEDQQNKKDRAELESKVDTLSKQLASEKQATAGMVKKLDELTKLAAQP